MASAIKNRQSTENLRGKGNAGRPKGSVNKIPAAVKDMILEALAGVGGAEYLQQQAKDNPGPFLALVGKVLPLQVTGEGGGPIKYVKVNTGIPRA